MTRKKGIEGRTLRERLKKVDYRLFFMALPFVIFIFMFNYAMLFGWIYAFVDFMPSKPIFQQDFVGLKHFIALFSYGSRFPLALKNTFIFGALGILVSPVPLLVAVLLSELPWRKFSRAVQTITSFPNFISWVLAFSLAFMFFSVEGKITQILIDLGLQKEGYNLLGDPNAVYWFQTLLGLWKGTGWTAIIYLSAIAGIDQELYYSAAIDGANRLQTIWHITIKSILPTFFVLLVLNISGLVSAGFDQYWVFMNTLTIDKLEVLSTYAYRIGIGRAQISQGTAIGIMQSLMSTVLLFTVNRLAKRITGNLVF